MNTMTDPTCYGCLGTGRIVGFSAHGNECICVARCDVCDAAFAYDHDEGERAPRLCPECQAEGLATFLVRYIDETGTGVEPVVAYVDAVDADAAEREVRRWGACEACCVFAECHGSYDVAPWECAAARRFYLARVES